MKTKKILLIAAAVVVAAAVLLLTTLGSMDKLIQAGIEKYGSEMTKADIKLDKVDVDLSSGKATLQGLYVGNPKGFETEYLTKLDEIKVALDLESITSSPVIIKEILIQGPVFNYEMASGGSNLDAVLKNVRDYVGAASGKGSKESAGAAGPRMIIFATLQCELLDRVKLPDPG